MDLYFVFITGQVTLSLNGCAQAHLWKIQVTFSLKNTICRIIVRWFFFFLSTATGLKTKMSFYSLVVFLGLLLLLPMSRTIMFWIIKKNLLLVDFGFVCLTYWVKYSVSEWHMAFLHWNMANVAFSWCTDLVFKQFF